MPPYPSMPSRPRGRREAEQRDTDERLLRRSQMRGVLAAARANGFGAPAARPKSRRPRLTSTTATAIVPGAAHAGAEPRAVPQAPQAAVPPPPAPPATLIRARPAARAGFYGSVPAPAPPTAPSPNKSSRKRAHNPVTPSVSPALSSKRARTATATAKATATDSDSDEDGLGLGTLVRSAQAARSVPLNADASRPRAPDSDATLRPSSSPTTRPLPALPAASDSDSDEGVGLGVLATSASAQRRLPRKTLTTGSRTPRVATSAKTAVTSSPAPARQQGMQSTPHHASALASHAATSEASASTPRRRITSGTCAPVSAPQRMVVSDTESDLTDVPSDRDQSDLDEDADDVDADADDDEVILLGSGRQGGLRSSRVTRVLNPATALPAKKLLGLLDDIFEDEDSTPVPAELAQLAATRGHWTSTWLHHIPGTRSRVVLRPHAVAQITKLVKAAAWPFAMRAASDVRDLATLESLFPHPRQLSDIDPALLARLARILTRTAAPDEDEPEPGAPAILLSGPQNLVDDGTNGTERPDFEPARHDVSSFAARCATACAAAECLASLLAAPQVPAGLLREDALSSSLDAVKTSIAGLLSPLTDAATLATPPTALAARFFASLALDLAPPTADVSPESEDAQISAVKCAAAMQHLLASTRSAMRALATLLDKAPLPPSEQIAIAAADVALTAFFLPAADDERTSNEVAIQPKSSNKTKSKKGKSKRRGKNDLDLPHTSPADLWNAVADPSALSRRRGTGHAGPPTGPLAPVAQAVLRTLFVRVPSQRAWIVDELVSSLVRFPLPPPAISDEPGFAEPRAPHALLLHLIQAAAQLPTLPCVGGEDEEGEEKEKEKEQEGEHENHDTRPETSQATTTSHEPAHEHQGESDSDEPSARIPKLSISGPLSGPKAVVGVVVRILIGRLSSLSAVEDARGGGALASLVADVGCCLGQAAWPGAGLLIDRFCSALLALLHLPARATSPEPRGRLHPSTRGVAIDVLARLLGSVAAAESRLAHLPPSRVEPDAVDDARQSCLDTSLLGAAPGTQPGTRVDTREAKVHAAASYSLKEPTHDTAFVEQQEDMADAFGHEDGRHDENSSDNDFPAKLTMHGPDQPLSLLSSVGAVEEAVQLYTRLLPLTADATPGSARDEARRFWLAQAWAEMDQLHCAAEDVLHPSALSDQLDAQLEPATLPQAPPAMMEHARQMVQASDAALRALASAWRSPVSCVASKRGRADRNLAIAHACLALSLATVRRTPLASIQAVLVDSLDDRVVGNRTRALRALATMTDHLWSDSQLTETVLSRLSDTSPSVRDAALQLVGTRVLSQLRLPKSDPLPTLQAYAPVLFSRAHDASLSVRKRALRLCAAAYSALGSPEEEVRALLTSASIDAPSDSQLYRLITQSSDEKDQMRIQLALTLVRAVGDDDVAVQQLALDEMQVIWFGIGPPSTPQPMGKGLKSEPKVVLAKQEPTTPNERLVAHARIVTAVCGHVQERPSPLEEAFRRVGRPSTPAGAGLGIREAETAEALERACRALVDHLLAALVGLEPAGGKFGDWMATVHTVVVAHPVALSVSRTKSLLPHLRAAQGAAELRIAELIIRILGARLPSLPRTARIFAAKLQTTLAAAINRVPAGVAPLAPMLQELVAAFSTATNTLTYDFGLLARMAAAAWGRWRQSVIFSGEGVPQPPTRAAALATSLTALLIEHTDFDALRIREPEAMQPLGALVSEGEEVRASLVRELLTFLPVASWRPLALRALGFLLRRHAQLWTRPDVAEAIAEALAPQPSAQSDPGDVSLMAAVALTGEPDQRTRHLILTTMTEFLALDDERLELATTKREREAVHLARSAGRSARAELLVGETDTLADSSVSTQVIQQYLDPVLSCLMNPTAPAVQTLALEVVRHTVLRGLAHPLQCLPALIGLETSTDARLATRAAALHTHLSNRHASLLHVRWPDHITAAFNYHLSEHDVLHQQELALLHADVSDAVPEPMLRGFQMIEGAPRALLGSWYGLVVQKRAARVEFLKALVRLVDVDVTRPVSDERLALARFAADNLATLPYKGQDEVIQVVHELIIMLTVSGMQTLAVAAAYGQRIETETVAILARAPGQTQAANGATARSYTTQSSPPLLSSPMRSSSRLQSSPVRNSTRSPSHAPTGSSPSGPARRSLRDRKEVFYGSSSSEETSEESEGLEEDSGTETKSSTTHKEDEGLESSGSSDESSAASDWSDAEREAGTAKRKTTSRRSKQPKKGSLTTHAASRGAAHTLGMRTVPGAEILALDMDLDGDRDMDSSTGTGTGTGTGVGMRMCTEGSEEVARPTMADHARAALAMSIALGLRMHLRWLYRVSDAQLTRHAELATAGARRRGKVLEASNRQANLRALEDPAHLALDLDTPLAAVQQAVLDAASRAHAKPTTESGTVGLDGCADEPAHTASSANVAADATIGPISDTIQELTDLHVLRLFQELVAADAPVDEGDDEDYLSDMSDDA